jgi:type II secretory pathway pseudopilin PulG
MKLVMVKACHPERSEGSMQLSRRQFHRFFASLRMTSALGGTKRWQDRARKRRSQQGYVLLSLLLFMALLAIAAATAAPNIAFAIKRDREEELVHRGVEYTRAIQRFAKANARYPLRLEELQSTGGTKYIRKLYKDPITGGDFRLLYMSDIRVATGTTVAGDPGFKASNNSALAPAAPTVDSTGSPNGQNVSTAGPASTPAAVVSGVAGATGGPNATAPGAAPAPGNNIGGGGAIVGVASKSKTRSIREFNKKSHYNEWLFFYLPNYTGAQRIKGPTSLTPPSPVSFNPGANQNQPPSGPVASPSADQK